MLRAFVCVFSCCAFLGADLKVVNVKDNVLFKRHTMLGKVTKDTVLRNGDMLVSKEGGQVELLGGDMRAVVAANSALVVVDDKKLELKHGAINVFTVSAASVQLVTSKTTATIFGGSISVFDNLETDSFICNSGKAEIEHKNSKTTTLLEVGHIVAFDESRAVYEPRVASFKEERAFLAKPQDDLQNLSMQKNDQMQAVFKSAVPAVWQMTPNSVSSAVDNSNNMKITTGTKTTQEQAITQGNVSPSSPAYQQYPMTGANTQTSNGQTSGSTYPQGSSSAYPTNGTNTQLPNGQTPNGSSQYPTSSTNTQTSNGQTSGSTYPQYTPSGSSPVYPTNPTNGTNTQLPNGQTPNGSSPYPQYATSGSSGSTTQISSTQIPAGGSTSSLPAYPTSPPVVSFTPISSASVAPAVELTSQALSELGDSAIGSPFAPSTAKPYTPDPTSQESKTATPTPAAAAADSTATLPSVTAEPNFEAQKPQAVATNVELDQLVSWGVWAKEGAAGAMTPDSNENNYYVSGSTTPQDKIQSLIDNKASASYSGVAMGDLQKNGAVTKFSDGTFSMQISFGAPTPIKGSISVPEFQNIAFDGGGLNSYGFAISAKDLSDKKNYINMNGNFFGSNADAVGGKFSLGNASEYDKSSIKANGVFKGAKQ